MPATAANMPTMTRLITNLFHVTVRADGVLIGCVRVTPLPEYSRSFIGRRVGPSSLEASVNRLNLARTDCVEAGRWIVAPKRGGPL